MVPSPTFSSDTTKNHLSDENCLPGIENSNHDFCYGSFERFFWQKNRVHPYRSKNVFIITWSIWYLSGITHCSAVTRSLFPDRRFTASKCGSSPFMVRWPRDWGLQVRMLGTMFLLALVYFIFIAVLAYIGIDTLLLVVIVTIVLLLQYFFSDRMALFSMGARVVSEQEEPQSL